MGVSFFEVEPGGVLVCNFGIEKRKRKKGRKKEKEASQREKGKGGMKAPISDLSRSMESGENTHVSVITDRE